MTENEVSILWHLNNIRSQNNVDHVLSETLKISDHDIKIALASLLEKGYVYEDSDINQNNEGKTAWKITRDGEFKINQLKEKIDTNKNAEATTKLAWATFIATAVGAIAVVVQCILASNQNAIQERQALIQEQVEIERVESKRILQSEEGLTTNKDVCDKSCSCGCK